MGRVTKEKGCLRGGVDSTSIKESVLFGTEHTCRQEEEGTNTKGKIVTGVHAEKSTKQKGARILWGAPRKEKEKVRGLLALTFFSL